MKTTKQRSRIFVMAFAIGCILIVAVTSIERAQQRQRQAVDSNGAPLFKVDPFWPKPLPNRWGMQQVTGISVDQNDHIWFLNRGAKADPEICGGLYHEKLPPCGTTYKLAFSRDPQQKYAYVADGTNDKVWILDRDSGKTLGGFGRNGTYAGQFHWINAIAMDSKGNIYTGEVEENKRIQKFVPVMGNN